MEIKPERPLTICGLQAKRAQLTRLHSKLENKAAQALKDITHVEACIRRLDRYQSGDVPMLLYSLRSRDSWRPWWIATAIAKIDKNAIDSEVWARCLGLTRN